MRIDHKGKHNKPSSVFSVEAANTFNELPNEIKDPGLTQKQFKNKLKILSRSMNLLTTH